MPDQIIWGSGREAAFIAYLDHEIREAQTARVGLDRQHRDWLSQYRVNPKPAIKRFPYEGASNYTMPLTAIDVDILYAGFMQTIHAPENIWTIAALNERWVRAAKPLQDFLTILDQRVLKMYNVDKRVFLECTKLGTGIYKTGWTYERRKVWTYDTSGKRVAAERIVSMPFVDHVRLADFLMPAYAYAIQPDEQGGAPWVGDRLRISLGRLYAMAEASAPFLPNFGKSVVDRIARYEESDKPPADVRIQELDYNKRPGDASATALDGDAFDRDQERGSPGGASVQRAREVELWEIHARFGTRSDYAEDDIVVWYHQPTRTIVRGVYAYYAHGKRPYDKIVYFPGDGFWGIGICEQKEMFQALGSDLMNFTLDNVVLANSRMIVAKSSANIGPGEPVYPNKVWITDGDVRQDFGVFPMADIYPSLPMVQQQLAQLGEKRTGVGDIQLGQMQNLPGRTPATTMMSLLQEGKRRPDLTIRDMRHEGLSVVGLRTLQNCQQMIASPVNYEGEMWLKMITDTLGMPEGKEVADKLLMPMEPVELGVGVSLTATSGSANKEVERQGALALLQIAGQVAPQIIQFVQAAVQARAAGMNELADVALNSAQGLNELYRQVLEQHDKRDIEVLLPLGDAVAQGAPGADAASAGADAGAGGIPQDAALDPAMAALFGAGGTPGGESGGAAF